MKLTANDYELLIKAKASEFASFARVEGTSLSYQYMRECCQRLIEITNEYNLEYPKEYRKNYTQ